MNELLLNNAFGIMKGCGVVVGCIVLLAIVMKIGLAGFWKHRYAQVAVKTLAVIVIILFAGSGIAVHFGWVK